MKPSETAHLRTFAATHPGMTGKLNEDRFSVDTFQLDKPTSQPAVLAVICDGIGGHRAGEVSAQIGVDVIRQTVAASDASQPVAILADAISRANQAVYAASLADSGRAGMGATCACAWIIGNRLYTVNLGDSRIYLCRDNHLLQLTTDHTWLQEAMDAAHKIGDDYLQKRARGQVVPDSFTHGSSAQRVQWFNTGLKSGQVTNCDTFNQNI